MHFEVSCIKLIKYLIKRCKFRTQVFFDSSFKTRSALMAFDIVQHGDQIHSNLKDSSMIIHLRLNRGTLIAQCLSSSLLEVDSEIWIILIFILILFLLVLIILVMLDRLLLTLLRILVLIWGSWLKTDDHFSVSYRFSQFNVLIAVLIFQLKAHLLKEFL